MKKSMSASLVDGLSVLILFSGWLFLFFLLGDTVLGNPLKGKKVYKLVDEDIENIREDNDLFRRMPYYGEFEYYKKNQRFSKDKDYAYEYARKNKYDEVRYDLLTNLIEKDLLLDIGESTTEEAKLYQMIIKNQLLYDWSKTTDAYDERIHDTGNLTIQQPLVALLDKTSKIDLDGVFTSREIGYTQTIHPDLYIGYPQVQRIDKDKGTYDLLTISYLPLGVWDTVELEKIIASYVPTSKQVKIQTGEDFLKSTENERTVMSDLTKECVVNGMVTEECTLDGMVSDEFTEHGLSTKETIDMYDQGLRKSIDVVESYFRFSPLISYLTEPKELLVGGVPLQVTYLIEELPTDEFTLSIIDKTYQMERVEGNKTVPLRVDWN